MFLVKTGWDVPTPVRFANRFRLSHARFRSIGQPKLNGPHHSEDNSVIIVEATSRCPLPWKVLCMISMRVKVGMNPGKRARGLL